MYKNKHGCLIATDKVNVLGKEHIHFALKQTEYRRTVQQIVKLNTWPCR